MSRHPKERGPGSGNEKVLSKVSGRWGCLTITLGPAKLCAPPCSRKSSPPPPPTLLGLSQAPARPQPACSFKMGLCSAPSCWPGGERGEACRRERGPPATLPGAHPVRRVEKALDPAVVTSLVLSLLWAACSAVALGCTLPGVSGPGGSCEKSQLKCQGSGGMGLHTLETGHAWLMSWQLLAAGEGTAPPPCLALPQWSFLPSSAPTPGGAVGQNL